MENAVKALQIAASAMIALIVLGFLVYFYGNLSRVQKTKHQTEVMQQSAEDNKAFESFNKDSLMGSELISLANKVVDNNNKFEMYGDDKYNEIVMNIKITEKIYFQDIENHSMFPSATGHKINKSTYTIKANDSSFMDNYEKIMNDIYNISTTSVSNGGKTFTFQQISLMSTSLKQNFLLGCDVAILEKYEKFQNLLDDQKDFSRAVFKQNGSFAYDTSTGRVCGMIFEEN